MSAATALAKPCVLFVDDEKRLGEVYADVFKADYDVHVAASGQEGLQKLRQLKNVAIVISDFHMPHMDGATFLAEVKQHSPLTVRILLTGTDGVGSAKDAVNKGQIFRFLTKPCPLDQFRGALVAGVEQHRLLNAERMVMQETLIECISALMEVLAVTNPVAFGRAQRLKNTVKKLSGWLDCAGFWQLEAAALLSQVGYFAVNAELAEKIYYGRELNAEEAARAATVPAHAKRLLEHIPRLEPALQILAALDWSDEEIARAGDRMVSLGARILGAALEVDTLTSRGTPKPQIIEALYARQGRYGERVVKAVGAVIGQAREEPPDTALEMPLRKTQTGMHLLQEIRNANGALLVPSGYEISTRLIDRISQIAPAVLDQNVRVSPAKS